jgi:hypothetical protein
MSYDVIYTSIWVLPDFLIILPVHLIEIVFKKTFMRLLHIPIGLNCVGWEANYTAKDWSSIVNHPCYTWTFIESFW